MRREWGTQTRTAIVLLSLFTILLECSSPARAEETSSRSGPKPEHSNQQRLHDLSKAIHGSIARGSTNDFWASFGMLNHEDPLDSRQPSTSPMEEAKERFLNEEFLPGLKEALGLTRLSPQGNAVFLDALNDNTIEISFGDNLQGNDDFKHLESLLQNKFALILRLENPTDTEQGAITLALRHPNGSLETVDFLLEGMGTLSKTPEKREPKEVHSEDRDLVSSTPSKLQLAHPVFENTSALKKVASPRP